MLVDRHDPGETPRLLVAVTQEITDGHDPARTITKRFGFAEISPSVTDAPAPDGVRAAARHGTWTTSLRMMPNGRRCFRSGTPLAVGRGGEPSLWTGPSPRACPPNWPATRELVTARVEPDPPAGQAALTQEINYWDMRHAELLDAESAGRQLKMKPETASAAPATWNAGWNAARRPGPRRGTDRPPAGRRRRRAGHPAGPAGQAARPHPGPGTDRPRHRAVRTPRRRRRPGRRTPPRPRPRRDAA